MSKTNAAKALDRVEKEESKNATWVGSGGHGFLDPTSVPRTTLQSLGVFMSVKCVEYFKQKGQKVPAGTPTYEAMEKEWERRQNERKSA